MCSALVQPKVELARSRRCNRFFPFCLIMLHLLPTHLAHQLGLLDTSLSCANPCSARKVEGKPTRALLPREERCAIEAARDWARHQRFAVDDEHLALRVCDHGGGSGLGDSACVSRKGKMGVRAASWGVGRFSRLRKASRGARKYSRGFATFREVSRGFAKFREAARDLAMPSTRLHQIPRS